MLSRCLVINVKSYRHLWRESTRFLTRGRVRFGEDRAPALKILKYKTKILKY